MSDKSLDILVNLGVIGKEDVKAVNDLLAENEKVTAKAAESTKLFSGEGREAHRIIGEINRILPGTGNLFREAFNPTALGAVGILVGLLYEAKSALDDYNKKLDEAGDRAAQPLDGGIAKLKDAWDDAQKSLGKYLAELHTQGQDEDATTRAVKAAKTISDAHLEGVKKEIEAAGKLGEANIRARLAGLDPAKVEAAVEDAAARTASQLAGLSASKNPDDLRAEKARREAAEHDLEKAAAGAQGHGAENKAAAHAEELKNLREANAGGAKAGGSAVGLTTIGDIQKLEDLMERVAKHQGVNASADPIGTVAAGVELAADGGSANVNKRIENLRLSLTNQKVREQELQKSVQADAELAETEKLIREAAEKALKVNQQRLHDINEEIPVADAVATEQKNAAAQVAADKKKMQAADAVAKREANGETLFEQIAKGANAQGDLSNLKAQGFTPEHPGTRANAAQITNDQQAISEMTQALDIMGNNHDLIAGLMRKFLAGQLSHEDELAQIKNIVDNFKSRLGTSPL